MAYSSILNYLSGLSHYLKSRGKQGVDLTNFCVRASLNGARRLCSKGRGKAPGIFPADLQDIFGKLDMSTVNDLVFWSAMTLAFRCLLRASNYCQSRHCVRVKDFLYVEGGAIVRLVSSKTNQFAEYVSEIPVYRNSNSLLCPIRWISTMLQRHNASPDEPLFRILRKGKWVTMSSSWLNGKLKSVCDLKGVSPHGLRRGGATYIYIINLS